MTKKALSPVIATVLLVSLAIVLGTIIYSFNVGFLANLSPPANCDRMAFKAEISNSNLDITNLGRLPITEAIIKLKTPGSLETIETITHTISPGRTESIPLSESYSQEEYIISPQITVEDKQRNCPDEFSQTIKNTDFLTT